MDDMMISAELLHLLRAADTPTVCNAVEVAQGRRGFAGFTRKQVISSDPAGGAIVGYARTAVIAAAAPSDEPADRVRQRRMDYYRSMSDGPRPAVAVIEDADGDAAVGAFWGEINTNVHKSLGLCGALTNGLMRDLGDLPPGFPVIAGSIGPSHGFAHVRQIGSPVTIFGLTVAQGDLIHADRHGAVVIPPDCIGGLAQAIARLRKAEDVILSATRDKTLSFEAFADVWAAFERART